MNIQDEVQKIHHQYGTTFKASYEIQKLFDNELKKMYSEEEMREFARFFHVCYESGMDCLAPKDWKEQFKKQKL